MSRPMALNVANFLKPVCCVPDVSDAASLTPIVSWWLAYECRKQVGYSSAAASLS